MDKIKLTNQSERASTATEDEPPGASARPRRATTLSLKAQEIYEASREGHCRTVDAAWRSVERALGTISRPSEVSSGATTTRLRDTFRQYQEASDAYAAFLLRTSTSDSLSELELHKAIDADRAVTVREKLRESEDERHGEGQHGRKEETMSHGLSARSVTSRRTNSSTISTAAAHKHRPPRREPLLDERRQPRGSKRRC